MTNEVKNVPQLRFPNFDGEWEEKQLGDVTKTNQGLQIAISDRKTKYEKGLYFYITNEFLRPNSQTKYYIENPPESVVAEKSDILMTRTGNTGKVITNVEGAFHNNFFKIKYNKSIIDRLFLFELLKSPKVNNKFLSLAGTSTIPDLNHSDFYSVYISFPTISEQQKIGEFFSKLDRQIELGEQKLEKLEEQKKGYMQQIFSQQLRFKDENGDYYSEWKEKLIKDILEFENNRRKPITSSLREIGKYPYYGATGIIDYVKDYIFDGETRLLIGEDGAKWGAFEESSFIAKNRYWVNNHAHVCKSKINNLVFLNYLLNYKELRTYVTGNAPAKLTYNNLSMIPMFLPSVYEQEKIGNFLKKIDELIGKQNKKINELKIRKQGFLQKMFI
ncbi:restriction endonuclease subunit S [Staphylococcus equorum]|uniref:restriction endonuclease subunit S n=1 Tax=Staphylococcus equorum TaxID=246432 RepID=UPI001867C922|nr:restriction endonuclease subunit S [Staphylococcus equorum]